tara:strand:+ start:2974 stop:3231 length:258 start_codon:yes stop_codon:yes gene_type:complete
MYYCKILSSLVFIVFFSLVINNYFSENFLVKKKIAREDYIIFLSKYVDNISTIKSYKNFKKFKDNSKYFKKNSEEKEFWDLLKTK